MTTNHFLFNETLELLMRGALSRAQEMFALEMRAVKTHEYVLLLSEKYPVVGGSTPKKSETGDCEEFSIEVEWLARPSSDDWSTINTSVNVRTFVDTETQRAGLIVLSTSDDNDDGYHDSLNESDNGEKRIVVYNGYGSLNPKWENTFMTVLHNNVFLVSPLTYMEDFAANAESSNGRADTPNEERPAQEQGKPPRKETEWEKKNREGAKIARYQETWIKAFENRHK